MSGGTIAVVVMAVLVVGGTALAFGLVYRGRGENPPQNHAIPGDGAGAAHYGNPSFITGGGVPQYTASDQNQPAKYVAAKYATQSNNPNTGVYAEPTDDLRDVVPRNPIHLLDNDANGYVVDDFDLYERGQRERASTNVPGVGDLTDCCAQ